MKLLFICNQGKHRSRTAAELFAGEHQTAYAGVYSEEQPVTQELLAWADTIFVMEEQQRTWIVEHYPQIMLRKRVLTLNIPDRYQYKQPALEKILIQALKEQL